MIVTSMVVLIALAAMGIACIISYGKIMRLYDLIKDTYMILDMNFKRRWDMTSDLLDMVEVYIKDKDKLNEINEVHFGVYEGLSRQRKNAINGAYSRALSNLIEVCKSLDEAPANIQESVDMKISGIEKIEAKIAVIRTDYNVAVLSFNDLVERFPHSIMASRMHIGNYDICN